ncbi:nucleotidyltransferase domain-containing protein [Thalassobacillus hwangdonensis]|uniref:Nucleotidyltransferase domain-containing protein n=1 Tax=Thalassobacillus hwangdonensis TaxID=546108 RepID=A0ABW3L7Y4_9BACI
MDECRAVVADFIKDYYPDSRIVLLSGSYVRGDHTNQSDVDLVIIDDASIRKSYLYKGWPIEAFVYDEDSLDYALFIEKHHGTPLMTRLCAEGAVIKGGKAGEALIAKGKDHLTGGPNPLPAEKLNDIRYEITDYLNDLDASDHHAENIFIVHALIGSLHRFILRANNEWTGEGKWMYRALHRYDKSLTDNFVRCIMDYQFNQSKDSLIEFADQVIAPFGGRLFDDYSQVK